MPDYIIVPVARREDIREALLKDVAEQAGLPCGEQGYTGMAARTDPGNLASPGAGEMLRTVRERVTTNGLFVAFEVFDANGDPVTFTDDVGGLVRQMDALAGTNVQGEDVPGLENVPFTDFPPDPPLPGPGTSG